MKGKYYTLVWQLKVEEGCYSWQPVKDAVVGIIIRPPREELFVINYICPSPGGFDYFLFVTKNNSLGGGGGSRPTGKEMVSALLIEI